MKKSLIALAVLASTGAAMAQSSVTLYGRLDVGFNFTEVETTGFAPVASNDQTKIDSSMLNTTYWGLKGSEDLGGGLKANFDLQSQFGVDTGTASATLFERLATVGLSGGFGAVNLGRQYTAYDALRAATNNVHDSNFAKTGAVWTTGVKDYSNRVANSVRWDSANYSGFSGAVAYGFGENDNLGTNLGDATDNFSLHAKYAAGPLLVGVAYQVEKLAQTNLLVNQDENKYLLFGASYDFGMAKLTGSYNMAENDTREDDEWQVGVSAPLGASADIALGYASSSSSGTGLADLDGQGWSLVGRYNLSKRTTLYAGYATSEVESGTIGKISEKTESNIAMGVRHLF
ncbi:porin [Rhodoferax sp.]|uniref:porin n=1 Tax=Rhodoferax sp. TaxID=50421 RepID=UPI0025F86214|nr:porin [Rhodoferax sp.]